MVTAKIGPVNAVQLGSRIRAVRMRRGLRQVDVATTVGVSQSTVSRIERGHVGSLSIADVERVAAALEIRIDLVARWRGGDLDRIVSAGHGAMHESIAGWFASRWPTWTLVHEASFSIYGERGVVDVVAWHARRRAVLIVELKTELVDINELAGTLDRKRRLAPEIVRDRGWSPAVVGTWLVIAASRSNERRVDGYRTVLRSSYPLDGRDVRAWLRNPGQSIAAMSLESFGQTGLVLARRRVRRKGLPTRQEAA